MTQEDKDLLLKDLSARLFYGVRGVYTRNGFTEPYIRELTPFYYGEIRMSLEGYRSKENYVEFKPYLRPLSSMTEKEENEWREFNIDPLLEAVGKPHTRIEDLLLRAKSQYEPLDWLNAHHFDYRGLIEKGLAEEAPEEMYN